MSEAQPDDESDEPAADRRKDTLFVTDEELIRRLGVPRKAARAALHMLDRTPGSGFPQKQALWGNRRYWPAVVAYFDRQFGLKTRSQARGAARDYDTG